MAKRPTDEEIDAETMLQRDEGEEVDRPMALIYEDKTRILRRCFFDVQNEVGVGRQEQDYHTACELWLKDHHIPFTSKRPHALRLQGQIAHVLFPDLVIWDLLTIELKAMPRNPKTTDFVQLFDYLKYRNDYLGLLVNMGLNRVSVDRIVYKKPQTRLEEDWQYWNDRISGRAREVGIAVRNVLRSLYDEHETGYGEQIMKKLVLFALRSRHLKVTVKPIAAVLYHNTQLRSSPLNCMVIEDCILLTLTALFDNNHFNINRCKSYLTALGLQWGVAANFGKTRAEFEGLCIENREITSQE